MGFNSAKVGQSLIGVGIILFVFISIYLRASHKSFKDFWNEVKELFENE